MNTTTNNKLYSEAGFPPETWGPHLWRFIHIICLNVPLNPTPSVSRAYFAFFKSLCHILPCGACREEFCKLIDPTSKTKELRLHPDLFKNTGGGKGTARQRAFTWSVMVHAAVSRRLHVQKMHTEPKSAFQNQSDSNQPLAHWLQKYSKYRAA
jgi:hypothetical protein